MANILIVDDSPIMRRNLSAILKAAGHTVVSEAVNGEDAFREYEKHKPDLVTMDITMPVMNGVEAVEKIIGSFEDAKIIMISALDQKFMVLSALQSGAKHYVIKPFTPEKVMQIINEVLEVSKDAEDSLELEAHSNANDMEGAIGSIKSAISSLNNTINSLEEKDNS